MSGRYVHVLLFACPNCEGPIAISRVSDQRNLELIDEARLMLRCVHCEKACEAIAVTAKRHYVDDWPLEDRP
jgi:hypothetical protein